MNALEEIKKALEGVTPGPWKAVSEPHFDSGLVYTSVQPVNVDEEAMKPLAMANGEYHVCRMSHSAAPWRFNYHRKNAHYIAAVNPAAITELLSTLESLQRENVELVERANEAVEAANALQVRAEAAEAEVKRLQAEIDRKSSMPGDHRYWEGRYREEAADNELLRSVLRPMAEVAGDASESWPDDAQVVTEIGHFRRARTALASTGGEHHAE